MNEERYEELAEKFEALIASHVEYQTNHDDAGAGYAHLPREGGWAYHNGDDRLREWMAENEFPIPEGRDWDCLIDDVLDDCDYEPGHIFSGGTTPEKFVVDSYEVGEIEDQYCFDDLCRVLEIDGEECSAFVALAMKDRRFCLKANGDGGVLSYTNTDDVWIYYVDRDWMALRLESIA